MLAPEPCFRWSVLTGRHVPLGPQASYGVEDPEYAVSQLAQTTMRSELGKLTLDAVFKERAVLNAALVGWSAMPGFGVYALDH